MDRLVILVLSVILLSPSANAALGEKESSIDTDAKALSGKRRNAVSHGAYTVHEIKTDSGTTREFVSSDGVVFAVAWNGVTHPDLSALLGSYFSEYQKGIKRQSSSRRTARGARQKVESDGVVVEKSGHMRALHGRAYVPKLIPQGVNLNEIN